MILLFFLNNFITRKRMLKNRDKGKVTRKENGMFSFTGLSPEQIDRLAAEYGIYAVRNGRICICGLNTKNVEYVAKSIAAVLWALKNTKNNKKSFL